MFDRLRFVHRAEERDGELGRVGEQLGFLRRLGQRSRRWRPVERFRVV
jgi:hypothetical protein